MSLENINNIKDNKDVPSDEELLKIYNTQLEPSDKSLYMKLSGIEVGYGSFGSPIGMISVYDVDGKREVEAHDGRINGVIQAKNGNIISYSNDGKIKVWSNDMKTLLEEIRTHSPINCVIENQQGTIISADYFSNIHFYKQEEGKLEEILEINFDSTKSINHIEETKDGKYIIACTADGIIKVVSQHDGKIVREVNVKNHYKISLGNDIGKNKEKGQDLKLPNLSNFSNETLATAKKAIEEELMTRGIKN